MWLKLADDFTLLKASAFTCWVSSSETQNTVVTSQLDGAGPSTSRQTQTVQQLPLGPAGEDARSRTAATVFSNYRFSVSPRYELQML